MAEKKAAKCAHPGCNCPVAKGSKYCGSYCEGSGSRPAIARRLERDQMARYATDALISLLLAATLLLIDRHRGGGHPPTPATPPCVRVRTRRFEMVTPTLPRPMTEVRAI